MNKIWCLLIVFCTNSYADGIVFNDNGRIDGSKVTTLSLNNEQIAFIDYWFKCRKRDEGTPYFFRLTNQQSKKLKGESGVAPKRFTISSSFNGDLGSEFNTNIINRYRLDMIEIPHLSLTTDAVAENWEKEIIGWGESVYSKIDKQKIKNGICPNA